MLSRYIKKIFLGAVFIYCSSSVLLAQPGDPGGDPDNPIPITGIEILIAAGGLFGAKKIYDSSKKKK